MAHRDGYSKRPARLATDGISRPRGRHLARAFGLPVPVAGLALLLAACSGGGHTSPGVASVGGGGSTTTVPSSPAGTGSAGNALAYAACMRSHGVPAFPDPDSQGGFSLPDGVNPGSPQYRAANAACKSFAGSGPPALSPVQSAERSAANLKFAECMRAHGISGFPDPNSSGGFNISSNSRDPVSINLNSPEYSAADKACQHLAYHGG